MQFKLRSSYPRNNTRTMNSTLLLINLAYLGSASGNNLAGPSSEYTSTGLCSPAQQRTILASVTPCQPRETLVDLRQLVSNFSSSNGGVNNVIQVIPDFLSVPRCGGSCDLYSHRCLPTSTRQRRVEVMVVSSDFGVGPRTETECGFVDVEEHLSCGCDCPVLAKDCREAVQYYEASSCQCLCRDHASRNRCAQRGMQWDPENCRCVCPLAGWKVCSSGYVFDYAQTCQCVPTNGALSATASVGALVACVVLVGFVMVVIVGGFFMYRRQVGIFRGAEGGGRGGKGSERAAAAAAFAETLLSHSTYDLVKNSCA